MRSFSCQLHQPLAWRVFVARIDSLYCNYLGGASSSNNIFFISIFWQKDKIAKTSTFSLRHHPVILRRLQWGLSVNNNNNNNTLCDSWERKDRRSNGFLSTTSTGQMARRWEKIPSRLKLYLWKWQTLQNSESRWLLKDSFLTPSVTFNIRSNTVILLKTFHK